MALDRGIRIPDSESEGAPPLLAESGGGVGQVLGFREGMTPEEVATAARAALGPRGQDAAIARTRSFSPPPW